MVSYKETTIFLFLLLYMCIKRKEQYKTLFVGYVSCTCVIMMSCDSSEGWGPCLNDSDSIFKACVIHDSFDSYLLIFTQRHFQMVTSFTAICFSKKYSL